MDVHTEKGDKASNSHSYEDVKGQLTGLSNHHHPPRRPCQAQISPCLHTGSLHCNCHSSLVRYTIHPILQMRRPELREVSQLAGRHTAGEQLSQESNPGVSESWRLTIPHHRHLPTLRLP